MLGHEVVSKTAGSVMRRFGVLACLAFGLAACAGSGKPAQTFVVFFGQWSDKLDDAGRGSVRAAADWAKSHPDAPITVVGYAPPDVQKAETGISGTRAQLVVDQLVADGIPAGRIARAARGPVDYTLSSQENRRVEIQVD